MRDILPDLEIWLKNSEEIALATVVSTWGSSPRPVGSKLAATRSGGIAGSVSGGCVEGAVIEECLSVLDSGQPSLLSFGIADDLAWDVGLPCGGKIQVFVEPFSAYEDVYSSLKGSLHDQVSCALVTHIKGSPGGYNRKLLLFEDGRSQGDLEINQYAGIQIPVLIEILKHGKSKSLEINKDTTLLVEAYPAQARLVIVGAVHTAEILVSLARVLGFKTIVVDPRRAFNNRERFPDADELVPEWPSEALEAIQLDSSAYVAVLTHDPKLDDPALLVALKSGARYIGALGSRRTNQKRLDRLRAAGLSEGELGRLYAPIGLDLGGRRPEEIAVSILGEIIKVRNKAPEG
jgi:xanthine dehydrogenase accessory factor